MLKMDQVQVRRKLGNVYWWQAALYIAAGIYREERNWVRQLEAALAVRGRRAAGCDASKCPEQNPDGRRSRRMQASSDKNARQGRSSGSGEQEKDGRSECGNRSGKAHARGRVG
jgi:hypothetical protein